jgi:DNA-binding LacI/PurR family transcriptional regulator
MKKVTIADIARIAGVTKGTVSMVINNYSRIPGSTKDRIIKIMKENDYYPFESAQNLGKGKNDVIAFMAVRFSAPFIAEILEAFERKAIMSEKYVNGIMPYSTRNDPKIRQELFRSILYGRKASCLVTLAINPDPKMVAEYKKHSLPLILIENSMKGAHSVNVDNFRGAFMAAEHLIKTGRKNIGLMSGGIDINTPWGLNPAAVERKAGFEAALKKHGRVLKAGYIEMVHRYTCAEGKELLDNFIKKRIKLDAVFCSAGDAMAMGVMERARELGMKIPGDLAVIGFDDMIFSAHLSPPLTTVRQPIEKLGFEAFDLAVAAIEGRLKKEKHIILEPELIIRKST